MEKSIKNILILLIAAALVVLLASAAVDQLKKRTMKPFEYISGTGVASRYVDWITPHAKGVGKKYGIPWQAIVVQTALETGWGKSSLLRTYNNFGGIKSVKGDNSVSLGTKEFINGQYVTISDGFATFKTPSDGLDAYGYFFHRNPRYAKALQYPNDPYSFIVEIKKAGYATDPNYVSKLHGMLDKYYPNLR